MEVVKKSLTDIKRTFSETIMSAGYASRVTVALRQGRNFAAIVPLCALSPEWLKRIGIETAEQTGKERE